MDRFLEIVFVTGFLACSLVAQEPSSPATNAPAPAQNEGKSVSSKAVTQKKTRTIQPKTNTSGSSATKHRPGQTPLASTADDNPKKIVVRQGGVREPAAQIVTDMDPAEATRKRTESENLLNSADESLKRLTGRTLNEQQQETVSQIDHYMTVARSALKEGDISRGHTLALKANLLARDVAKP